MEHTFNLFASRKIKGGCWMTSEEAVRCYGESKLIMLRLPGGIVVGKFTGIGWCGALVSFRGSASDGSTIILTSVSPYAYRFSVAPLWFRLLLQIGRSARRIWRLTMGIVLGLVVLLLMAANREELKKQQDLAEE